MDIKKALLVKSFRRITNNHSLSQSQQLMQAAYIQREEIRMSINLPYARETSEKLPRILRSYKIRSIFYTEKTLSKPLCKPKDSVATEDKKNIAYEIDCSNYQVVYFVNLNGL